MNFYYVGLAMQSEKQDYAQIHRALFFLNARKVSRRIWMLQVEPHNSDAVFSLLKQYLDANDQMLVAEVPESVRRRETFKIAA